MTADAWGWVIWIAGVLLSLIIREAIALWRDDDDRLTLSRWMSRLQDRFGLWSSAAIVTTLVGGAAWLVWHWVLDRFV